MALLVSTTSAASACLDLERSLHFEGGIEAAKRCREGSRGDEGGGEAADHDGEHGGKPPIRGVVPGKH